MRKFSPFLHRSYKPLLHKKGKQWIVVGLSALTLMGLGSVFNFNANADTNTSNVKNSNNNNVNANYVSKNVPQAQSSISVHPENITKQAQNLHSSILNNNENKTANIGDNSSKTTNTLNLGNSNQQKRSWNFVQHGVNAHDYDNNNYGNTNASSASNSASMSANTIKNNTSSASTISNPTKTENTLKFSVSSNTIPKSQADSIYSTESNYATSASNDINGSAITSQLTLDRFLDSAIYSGYSRDNGLISQATSDANVASEAVNYLSARGNDSEYFHSFWAENSSTPRYRSLYLNPRMSSFFMMPDSIAYSYAVNPLSNSVNSFNSEISESNSYGSYVINKMNLISPEPKPTITDTIHFQTSDGTDVGTIHEQGLTSKSYTINNSDIPTSNFTIAPSNSNPTTFTYGKRDATHTVIVSPVGNNHINLEKNTANISGGITLHLTGKNNTTRDVTIPYSIQGKVGEEVNLLQGLDGYNNINSIYDLIGREESGRYLPATTVDGINLSGFSPDSVSTTRPWEFNVPSNMGYNNDSTPEIKHNVTINLTNPNADLSDNKLKSYSNKVKYIDQNEKTVGGGVVSGNQVNANLDVPDGYRLPDNTSYHFNSDGQLENNQDIFTKGYIRVEGQKVVGTATIYRKYKQSNGHVDIKPKQIVIHGEVGDSTTINPSDYNMIGYKDSNQPWTINFTPSDVNHVNENGFNFNPTHTFTYNGQDIAIAVQYVDSSNGSRINIGNASAPKYSDELANAYALEGSTIDLKTQNAFDNTAIVNINGTNYTLHIPTGYHLENNDNYLTVTQGTKSVSGKQEKLTNAQGTPMMLLTLRLSGTKNNNKPNNNTPVTPNTPNIIPNNNNNNTPVTPDNNPVVPNSNNNNNPIIINPNVPNKPNNNNNGKPQVNNNNIIITPKIPNVPNNKPNNNGNQINNVNIRPIRHHNKIKKVHSIKALINVKPNHTVSFHDVRVKNITNRNTPYYVYNVKNILLHRNIHNIGNTMKYSRRISEKRGFTGKILREFKINNKKRFLVRWHNHDYFVTARKKFVRNAYIQPSQFNKHAKGVIKQATIKLRKSAKIYNSIHFNAKHFKHIIKKGSKVRVVDIKRFGNRNYKRTRFVLANGLIITANKNFVKFI